MNTGNSIPRVLTIDRIPKYFPGITQTAARSLVKSGKIPSLRVGIKYLITPEAVEKWLDGNTAQ